MKPIHFGLNLFGERNENPGAGFQEVLIEQNNQAKNRYTKNNSGKKTDQSRLINPQGCSVNSPYKPCRQAKLNDFPKTVSTVLDPG